MGMQKFPSAHASVLGSEAKRKSCQDCPSFQTDSCFSGGAGDNPAHLIIVGRAPSVYSIGSKELFQGSEGRLFRNFFSKEVFPRIVGTNVSFFFTYAAMGGRKGLTSNHIRCCQPNLYRDLERVGSPIKGKNPVIVTLGPEPLKAVGVHSRKIVDAVGKVFTTSIPTSAGPKTFNVVPLLSMEHLDAQPGVSRTLAHALIKAVKLATQTEEFQSADNTKDYITTQTPEEIGKLVDTIIGYTNSQPTDKVQLGPEHWEISLDTETNTLYPFSHEDPRVLILSVAWDAQKAGAILLDHEEVPRTAEEREQVLGHVKRLLTCNKPKAFHNWKFDQKFLEGVLGIKVYRVAWDTLLAEHFLDEDKKGLYSLKKLTPVYAPSYQAYDDELQQLLRKGGKRDEKEYSDEELLELASYGPPIFVETEESRVRWDYLVKKLEESMATKDRKLKNKRSIMKAINDEITKSRVFLGISTPTKKKLKDGAYEKVPLDVLGKYAATDADVTRILCKAQVRIAGNRKELADLKYVLKELYLPASRVLSQMEYRGFRIDQDYLSSLEKDVAAQLETLRSKIHILLGDTINLNGPTQVSNAMLKLGFEPLPGLDSIDSTAKGVLDQYTRVYSEDDPRHQFADMMLLYRECHKTGKSFLKPIREFSKKDGKVHCEFHLNGTATGRLCVAGDTILNTDHGPFRIDSLPTNLLGVARVGTHTGKWQRVLQRFYKGREAMYLVDLDNGSHITCTQGHRFLTPTGWRSLHDLSKGVEVTISAATEATKERSQADTRRSRLSTVNGRGVHRTARPSDVSVQPPCLAQLHSGVCGKARGQDTPLEERELRQFQMGQHPRSQSGTRLYSPQRRTSGIPASRHGHRNDGQEVWRNPLVCACKYTQAQPTTNPETPRPDAAKRPLLPTETRTLLPGYNHEGQRLLRRSSRLLSGVVRRLLRSYRALVVHQGASQGPQLLCGKKANTEGSHLLEFEPARNGTLAGPVASRDTSPTPLSNREVLGRFLLSQQFSGCRSRWEFPRSRLPNEEEGCKERKASAGKSHCPAADNYRRPGKGYSGGTGPYPRETSRIRSIAPAGVQDVWDIEVEEDHSYAAHGFVNHNSSSDPNLQNIPAVTARRMKTGPDGEKVVLHPGYNIKKLFVPSEKGKVIVNCDISGAELRVLTAYTKDSAMIKAINDGMDFHSYTASRIFKIPYEEVLAKKETDKDISKKRKKAKTLVFCTIYGGGPGRIAQQAECSFDEAKDLQAFLFQAFPKVQEYISNTEREVRQAREVTTFFHRHRRFPLVGISQKHTSDAIREAVNFKIQSTSSDLVLSQLIEINDNIKEIEGELLITVHDSYVLEIPENNVPLLKPFFDKYITQRVREKNPWLPVPFLYELEVGPSYGEAKELK